MSIPSVLLSGVRNESQDLQITTDVSGKWLSGLLGIIKNARLYASGQLISDLRNAGEKIHLEKSFKSQEFREEYCDVKTGGNSKFMLSQSGSNNSPLGGAIMTVDDGLRADATPYFRGVGLEADNNGYEVFVLLEELFPMLRDIQLPVRFLKDEIRIELDWNQSPDDYMWVAGTAVADEADRKLTIQDCVLFLDYIKYNDEVDGALEASLNTTGVSIPFRQTAVITKALAGTAGAEANISEDILLGQEGRAVMKIFVSKKYNNTQAIAGRGNVNQTYNYQGVCRSERLQNERWNPSGVSLEGQSIG